ncbi:chromate efflux transporter [Roseibium aestuarii]|uniref:Chromate efflux transporter n=1 Tax=Roseibium aestuarii TaxID=2600299 RepID=A0ABW4JXX9_9HYPH|nr:chromate efflux transporter [Roseibium aestuarii]
MSDDQSPPGSAHALPRTGLTDLARAGLKIGLLSFGGPAGQIALMHEEFVTRRRWLDNDRFQHALGFCMLLPGPEAQQLATYCGWLVGGLRGGLIAGGLFILPGALLMAAVSCIYVLFGQVPAIEAVFYGLKASILAIVLRALWNLSRSALAGPGLKGLAGAAFVALFLFGAPFPLVVIAAGLIGYLLKSPDASSSSSDPVGSTAPPVPHPWRRILSVGLLAWAAPIVIALLILGRDNVLLDISAVFSGLALVSFGGAYALLSYLAQSAVDTLGWLTAGQMLDGLALAETTPGPLILVTQFVGFLAGWNNPAPLSPLAGGLMAALVTTWVTFAPSFLFVLLGAPFMERLRGMAGPRRMLAGIRAAVAGTILNLSLWFALHTLFATIDERGVGPVTVPLPDPASLDPVLAMLTLAALVLAFATRAGLFTLMGLGCVAGLLTHAAGLA